MRKRQAYSIFLLGIILPVLLLSSFHHHPSPYSEDTKCVQCTDHVPHGHLSTDQHLSDCLICHFLGLPYLLGSAQILQEYSRPRAVCFRQAAPDAGSRHVSAFLTRGPPAIFRYAGL